MQFLIQSQREFTKECKTRNFSRLAPSFYARCHGDGLYQTIYTGFRDYVDPSSSSYSDAQRTANTIRIGIRSLYSQWKETIFVPGRCAGVGVMELVEKRRINKMAQGILTEYRQMEEYGFDALDALDTQEKYLDFWSAVNQIPAVGGGRVHSFQLIAPFLMCGKTEEAVFEISRAFTHTMVSFYREGDILLQNGQQDVYLQKEAEKKVLLSMHMQLWHWIVGQKFEEVNRYLSESYCQNMSWVEKYGIPLSPNFVPRQIPDKF